MAGRIRAGEPGPRPASTANLYGEPPASKMVSGTLIQCREALDLWQFHRDQALFRRSRVTSEYKAQQSAASLRQFLDSLTPKFPQPSARPPKNKNPCKLDYGQHPVDPMLEIERKSYIEHRDKKATQHRPRPSPDLHRSTFNPQNPCRNCENEAANQEAEGNQSKQAKDVE
jgi:hypothetical protein